IAVDPLALIVHDLVVFEQVLADVEVLFLDLLLGGLDAAADHAALDRLTGLHAEPGQDSRDPFAGEDTHQVVLQRQEESARTRIALPTGAAAKLIVDAARLVAFGADDVQPAHAGDLAAFYFHLLVIADHLDGRFPDIVGNIEAGGVFVLEASPGEGLGVAAQ